MNLSWLVAIAYGTAVAAQFILLWWLARTYSAIPTKIPYGTLGKEYFWYGPRGVVWLAPVSWLAILGVAGVVVARGPSMPAAQVAATIGFFLMAAATPLIALAINAKITAARRRGR